MQLVVRVESGDRTSTFKIQVGDGRKSFKWLALVAAQRFGSESPKGKLRQRERKFPCTNPANTNLVPSRCYTDTQDFFHPDALLVEQLQDGDQLTVEVAPRVFVDEAGSPVKSRWQTIAFAVSPSSSAKRDAAIAEEYDAQNAKKVAIKALEDEAERLENMRKADHVREIIADQLPDQDAVEEALSEDWFSMNKKRVLDALVEDPEEQGRIKDVLKQHYVQLDELFKTFAASGSSIADAQDLELSEFEDFCHQVTCRVRIRHRRDVVRVSARWRRRRPRVARD
jgi:predicted transcriptional regulator